MLARRLDQDRLRNRPDLAAERLVLNLRKNRKSGKLFWAIDKEAQYWRDQGDKNGELFEINIGLEIAKINHKRAKPRFSGFTSNTLGWCYLRLAERQADDRNLMVAQSAFQFAIKKTDKRTQPKTWSIRQNGLATALSILGERKSETRLLNSSISIQREALAIAISYKTGDEKVGWNNLGTTLSKLGAITENPAHLVVSGFRPVCQSATA